MNIPLSAAKLHRLERARGVRVVLGPTNTGKTHYAIERMLAHPSGMIGLPLRLLAREVYNRVAEKTGADAVALITGEEKIKPKNARYYVSTVEAMPRDLDLSFVAIDEIQLGADFDRGHIFTDRLLNRRGAAETLLVGASTMQKRVEELVPGAPILSRPRFSKLSFAGSRKISRLPRRTAIVAFSVEEVYAIAEWIRRQRGGAAVVLGALSPRTRNAQVEIYQNGDVDYIVATDAIGMGLNLDVDHIAFASDRKFDGRQYRRLTPAEFGQIAGRAGRHMRDGTFGTTGRCPPFEEDLVEALEDHRFEQLNMLQWRNTDLDFDSIAALLASLDAPPQERGLTRAPIANDQLVLEALSRDEKVKRETKTKADVARLWDTCQIPDYRKLSPGAHAELVLSIYSFIIRAGHIPEDWFARHISELDRVDGDLDTLSARIAQVRTWTFIANRPDWLRDPEHWQSVTRQVEDTLSDALHERLAQRFVDRRTSVLMRRLRENAMLEAEITTNGDVLVEDQHVGHLSGFRFAPDPHADGEAAKALNAAAQKALASEIEGRARRVHEAVDEAFVLANDGIIRWLGEPVGKIAAGEKLLEPRVHVLADEQLTGTFLEMVQRRLDLWAAQHIKKLLGPLIEIEKGEGLEGIARGIGFRIAESLGVLERAQVAEDVKSLSQEARAALRKFGVRFGAYHIYMPALVKPAPRALAAQLWALRNVAVDEKSQAEVPHLAASGRTSFAADKDVPKGFYRAAGFQVCGERAVRVDILERLVDLIRPAISYRPGTSPGDPPPGAADGDGFVATVAMTSLAGCSGEAFASILRGLGYVSERRKGPPITVPLIPKAATEPVTQVRETQSETQEPQAQEAREVQAEAAEPDVQGPPIEEQSSAENTTSETETAATDEASEPAATELVGPAESEAVALEAAGSEATGLEAIESQASAELSSEPGAELPATSDPPPAVEEMLIEVWRPYRHQRRNQRPKQARDRARIQAQPASLPRQEQSAERKRERRPIDRPMEERPHAGQRQERHSGPRKGKDKTEPHRHGGEGRRVWASSERSRERQPDPNSPFAKLLLLKQQMESKN
ncbi:MAG TPA: helicase-related protein [Methylovirgula sp.]|nr:helicase-related protein [Methylovirgula sp.]